MIGLVAIVALAAWAYCVLVAFAPAWGAVLPVVG